MENTILSGIIAGLTSGSVLAIVIGMLFKRYTSQVEEEIKSNFQRQLEIFKSKREWKEQSLSELLGPLSMQFDRTKRAFKRWEGKNLFLEQKVIRDGNVVIRDLLLTKAHLIPSPLFEHAGLLVEHYDRWLEEFENKRLAEVPDLETPFIFVGPAGYTFPSASEEKFQEIFRIYQQELYGVAS